MKLQITATSATGQEVKRFIDADRDETDAQVIERFVAEWTADGDAVPTGIEITGRWVVQS